MVEPIRRPRAAKASAIIPRRLPEARGASRRFTALAEGLPDTPEGDVARKVRQLRVDRGWSQAMLAERMTASGMEWHQTTVAKAESAERALRYNEIVVLADALGVMVEDLLGLETPVASLRVLDLKARLERLLREESEVVAALVETKKELDALALTRTNLEDRRRELMEILPEMRRDFQEALSKEHLRTQRDTRH